MALHSVLIKIPLSFLILYQFGVINEIMLYKKSQIKFANFGGARSNVIPPYFVSTIFCFFLFERSFISEQFDIKLMQIGPLKVKIWLLKVCGSAIMPNLRGSIKRAAGPPQVRKFDALLV